MNRGCHSNCTSSLPIIKHSWCHSIFSDNLELSGVVIVEQKEKIRSHSELIAGIAMKLEAIGSAAILRA